MYVIIAQIKKEKKVKSAQGKLSKWLDRNKRNI